MQSITAFIMSHFHKAHWRMSFVSVFLLAYLDLKTLSWNNSWCALLFVDCCSYQHHGVSKMTHFTTHCNYIMWASEFSFPQYNFTAGMRWSGKLKTHTHTCIAAESFLWLEVYVVGQNVWDYEFIIISKAMDWSIFEALYVKYCSFVHILIVVIKIVWFLVVNKT